MRFPVPRSLFLVLWRDRQDPQIHGFCGDNRTADEPHVFALSSDPLNLTPFRSREAAEGAAKDLQALHATEILEWRLVGSGDG